MLTHKQHELLLFIHQCISESGIPPSFDEMKEAVDIASKSGIHRLIVALEERGFIRRLPNRARALEIIKLPPSIAPVSVPAVPPASVFKPDLHLVGDDAATVMQIPVMGRIAAGVPIAAIAHQTHMVSVPLGMVDRGEHYALEVRGDSMIEAAILDGDTAIIQKTDMAQSGEIVVALIDEEEATLKYYRRKGAHVILAAANPAYEARIFPVGRIRIQGRLVGLLRRY